MNDKISSRPPSFAVKLILKVAVVATLVVVWAVASQNRLPASLSMIAFAETWEPIRGASAETQANALSAMRVFNRVMLLMKDNYVDPKRIDTWKMFQSALDGIERQVAEVLVDVSEETREVSITVGDTTKTFSGQKVNNLWSMSFELKKVMDFLAASLPFDSKNDARDIEYAAVNGILSTLDPHSTMLKDEYFKELSLHSKGEFGGLGFVLQMKEGDLTIVRVMKGTPAQKAGLKSRDVITKINGESMVNADLSEAVDRIRGKPGTKVTLTVKRSSWKAVRDMTLARDIIRFDSVQSKLLENGIAYVRLTGFQGNTAADLKTAIQNMTEKSGKNGLVGLVLDLRGNPGGLLDQAGLIADMFLAKGDIVTTVGYSDKLRDAIQADADSDLEKLPIIVLANSASASASEIVAGALKNNDRAMVIGRQTFGKGSVQVLFDKFPDKGALKLTIAQYLTPGNISIQEVGITPDIELVPGRIHEERLDFFAPEKKTSEADLEQHLGNPDASTVATKHEDVVQTEKPLETFVYLREAPRPRPDHRKPLRKTKADEATKTEDDLSIQDLAEYEGIDPDTDEIVEDFPIRFAQKLLVASPVLSRSQMLEETKALREKLRGEEEMRVQEAIERLGIDWRSAPTAATDGKDGGAPQAITQDGLSVSLSSTGPFQAGETVKWRATVKNEGSQTFHRLKAYSESTNLWFDSREFIFGQLKPNESKTWTTTIRLPKDMSSRREPVTLHFAADGAEKLMDFESEVSVRELPHPTFAFSWNLVDDCKGCNGDGILQKGETVSLNIDLKNVGQGKSFETVASVRNKDFEEGLSLIKARSRLGTMQPGETKRAQFKFELKPNFDKSEAVIQIILSDEETNEWVVEVAKFPVQERPGNTLVKKRATFESTADTAIFAWASPQAPVLAQLPQKTKVTSTGTVGDFQRISFSVADGREESVGFVLTNELAPQKTSKIPKVKLPRKFMRQPPIIALTSVDGAEPSASTMASDGKSESSVGIVTHRDAIVLKGTAQSDSGLKDMYVYANTQKVFFKGANSEANTMEFDVKIPLKEGKNVIHLVTRQNRSVQAYKMIIATRLKAKNTSEEAVQNQQSQPSASTQPGVSDQPQRLP